MTPGAGCEGRQLGVEGLVVIDLGIDAVGHLGVRFGPGDKGILHDARGAGLVDLRHTIQPDDVLAGLRT